MNDVAAPADPAPFADPLELLRGALRSFLPPERITVAEYAAAHRWLDNRGGGYVGRWNHDEAPYLTAPMEALTSREHLTVAIVGPGRSGKTAVAENWALHSVGADPADMLWYEPTDDALQSYVKRVINPMIDSHDVLRQRLGSAPVDRSLHFKRFQGMWIEFLAATYNNLIGKSAPRIVVDEIDAVVEQGAYDLVDLRRQTFGRESKVLVVSHPDKPESEPGVMQVYQASDRRMFWWSCPECGDWSSPNPFAARVMALHYDEAAPLDEIADMACLLCPSCGSRIPDQARRAMNLGGRWIGQGQAIAPDGAVTGQLVRSDVAGFWIVGAMSPFVIGGIGALARARVEAERAFEGTQDDTALRSVLPKRLGIPYGRRQRHGELDAETLAERAEPFPLGVVPEGVRFLTAAIDVQTPRFELLVRGWGVRGESWVIDMQRVAADPAVSPGDWDKVLARLDAGYQLSDGSGRAMRIRGAAFDSGGAPGVTLQAYDAWRRLRDRKKTRFLGSLDGRDVWTAMPAKGLSGPNGARLQVVYPNSRRRDRDARAAGQVPVILFNPNRFKDDLGGQLQRAEPGPWKVHFPDVLRGAWPLESREKPHAWFEQVTAESPNARGVWDKVRANAANEALDLLVYTHVAAELHGMNRIDWGKPPSWAAEWDRNTSVFTPPTAAEAMAGAVVRLGEALGVVKAAPAAPATSSRFSRMV